MQKYDIFTDSSCDLDKEVIEIFDLKVMQLEVTIDDNEPVFNRDIDITKFYEQLKNGANAKNIVNIYNCDSVVLPHLFAMQ